VPPAEHRAQAYRLEQLKDKQLAQWLAKHHRYLAKSIQEKLNKGTARIRIPV
jgi:hypothetical protein